MGVIRSLWANVQGSPVVMRRINGWLAVFFLILIPVAYGMGWFKSVTFVSALSLWALVSGHWGAWQAARVEVMQQDQEKRMASEVVERIVSDTQVERAE